MHGKVQGTGAASDNGARGRGTGAREGIGTGAECDNGARGRYTGAWEGAGDRGRARYGDGVWVHGKVQEGTGVERDITVHGRAREGVGDRGSE